MTRKAKLILAALLVLSASAGSVAAVRATQGGEALFCPGTVNPVTFKCELGNCQIGQNCCGCQDD